MTPKTRKRRAAKQRKHNEHARYVKIVDELTAKLAKSMYGNISRSDEIRRLEMENKELKARFQREGG